MIFWDPVTSRMNVSANYKLDPTGSVPGHFPSVCYDGLISPLILRGERNSTKEPFPRGSKITIEHDGDFLPGTVTSVPIRDSDEYCVTFEDSAQPYQVPIEKITGEGKPTLHMLSIDPDSPITAAPPRMPEWLQENTYVTILTDGARQRGTLQSTDQGWTFTQGTASGRTTYTLDLADLPVMWEDRITEGSLELGWQATERAYHVSAAGITGGIPRSFRISMEPGHKDRSIWLESYLEEAGGLKEQDTYVTLSAKEYATKYSDIQIIPSISVQTIKQDENRNPVSAKTRIVALGKYEETIWTKSEKYAPVLRDESSRLMTSMAVERG
jgi:hypothetical protein